MAEKGPNLNKIPVKLNCHFLCILIISEHESKVLDKKIGCEQLFFCNLKMVIIPIFILAVELDLANWFQIDPYILFTYQSVLAYTKSRYLDEK